MKVRELREAVPGDTLLWIETEQEEYREAGENSRLSCKYDDVTIVQMFPQHYKYFCGIGITVHI